VHFKIRFKNNRSVVSSCSCVLSVARHRGG